MKFAHLIKLSCLVLVIHAIEAPSVYCSGESDLFLHRCDNLLRNRNYQTVTLDDSFSQIDTSFQQINSLENLNEQLHFEASVDKHLEKIKSSARAVGKFVFLNGMGVRYIGKALGNGIDLIVKVTRKCLKKNEHDCSDVIEKDKFVYLEELLPPRISDLYTFRGVTGGLMVLLGVTSVYTTLDGLVLVPIYFHFVEGCVEVICHKYEHHLNKIEKRSRIVESFLTSSSCEDSKVQKIRRRIAENSGNLFGEMHHSFDFLSAGGLAVIPEEVDEVFHAMSVAMGISSFCRGNIKLYECIKGPEKHKELIRTYEELFKEVVDEALKLRKCQLQQLLDEGRRLVESGDDGDIMEVRRRIHALRQALQWIDQFEERAGREFSSRISSLDSQIRCKERRSYLQDQFNYWFGQSSAQIEVKKIEVTKRDLGKYVKDLLNQNQRLKQIAASLDLECDANCTPSGSEKNTFDLHPEQIQPEIDDLYFSFRDAESLEDSNQRLIFRIRDHFHGLSIMAQCDIEAGVPETGFENNLATDLKGEFSEALKEKRLREFNESFEKRSLSRRKIFQELMEAWNIKA
jgi:hypothetical protein